MSTPVASRGRAHAAAGFTLVEVLLTLLIMAGILVTITQVLTGARKTRDEIHNIQDSQLAGPAILQRMERDLRALCTFDRDRRLVLRVRDRTESGYDADTLDFVTAVRSLTPWREAPGEPYRFPDLNEVGYRLRSRPDSDDFLEIYRREDFGVDDDPFGGGSFALLHDRVKGFNVVVYPEDGPDVDPLDGWDPEEDGEQTGLPARIELELTIELAPRLIREQLIIDRRTLTYRRVVRFPELLRTSLDTMARPLVPDYEDEPETATAVGGPGGPGGPGTGDDDDGAGRGGGTGNDDDDVNPFGNNDDSGGFGGGDG